MHTYFDSHCHLAALNPDATVQDALNCGVGGMVLNSANMSDWGDVIRIASTHSCVYGAIGVHPWYIKNLPNDWDVRLEKALQENPKLILGEIGLDKYHDDMAAQIDIFTHQLEMAHRLKRGVVLHCVGMWGRAHEILRMHRNELPPFIVAHGYSGAVSDIAKFANEYNMYFSYGNRELSHGARSIARIIDTPHNRILVESDSAQPSDVIKVADKISLICGVSPSIFYENAVGVFNK